MYPTEIEDTILLPKCTCYRKSYADPLIQLQVPCRFMLHLPTSCKCFLNPVIPQKSLHTYVQALEMSLFYHIVGGTWKVTVSEVGTYLAHEQRL